MGTNSRFSLSVALAWVVGVALFIPILWMMMTAIRPEHELYQIPLKLLPGALDWSNLETAWTEKSFGQYFYNSTLNSTLSVMFSMPIGIITGYAFSRFEIRHSKYYRAYVLFAYMVPIIILVVPFYLVAVQLNLYNTRLGHVLGLSTYAIPFATWVMIGYFEQIPREVEHSAAVDGASRMKTLIYILIPMARTGIIATALLTFILAWDDYIFALILLDSEHLRTLPLAIGYLSADYELTDGLMMAMGTITTLPILFLFVFFQKYFVGGMTSGAVKG